MKRVMLFVTALAVATPAMAQQVGAAVTPPPAGQARGAQPQVPPIDVPWNDAIPPGTPDHMARALKETTRHNEIVKIPMAGGTALTSFVAYPERKDKAGVVLVIHDNRGLTDSTRSVADQLAQDGFIAIAVDFVSGLAPGGGGTEALTGAASQILNALTPEDVIARLNAAMEYGKKLPASNGKTGVVGFCWGGARSFLYAAGQPALNAAVVYYGDAPGAGDSTQAKALANVKAPVLGLYAGNDARINMTLPDTEAAMKTLGRSYQVHIFEGSGHGFMSSQAAAAGANLKAAQESWPLALAFFRTHLK